MERSMYVYETYYTQNRDKIMQELEYERPFMQK